MTRLVEGICVPETPYVSVHELSEVNLGVLELSCANGYIVSSYDLGHPEARPNINDRTFGDGALDYTLFSGARVVSMSILLDGNAGTIPRLRDRLAAYLQPARRVDYRIQEPRDERIRRMTLRGSAGGCAISHPKFNAMTASWVCSSGLIESDLLKTAAVVPVASGDTGRTYDLVFDRAYTASSNVAGAVLTNEGNAPAPWVIRLHGPITNPILTLDGQSLRFTASGGLNLLAGQVVVIESIGKQVYYDDGVFTSALQYLDFTTSAWWSIPGGDGVTAGTSQFSLSASAFGSAGQAIIYYRDTWT